MPAMRRTFLQGLSALMTFGLFEARVMAEAKVASPTDLHQIADGQLFQVLELCVEESEFVREDCPYRVVGTTFTREEANRLKDLYFRDLVRFRSLTSLSNELGTLLGNEQAEYRSRYDKYWKWATAVAKARENDKVVEMLKTDRGFLFTGGSPETWEEPYDVIFQDLTTMEARDLQSILAVEIYRVEEYLPGDPALPLSSHDDGLTLPAPVAGPRTALSEFELLKRYERHKQMLASQPALAPPPATTV